MNTAADYDITTRAPGEYGGVCGRCIWSRTYTRRDNAARGVRRHITANHPTPRRRAAHANA